MPTRYFRDELVKESTSVLDQITATADEERSSAVVIEADASNQVIQFPVTIAQVQWLRISADGAMTVVAKNGADVAKTFVFTAARVLRWVTGDPLANPLAGAVDGALVPITALTQLQVTSTSGGVLKIEVGYDQTP